MQRLYNYVNDRVKWGKDVNKKDRQQLIKLLVHDHDIQTQEELLELLKENGVTATQATVSRDIKEMQLVKSTTASGKSVYMLYQDSQLDEQKLIQQLRANATDLVHIQFLNILRTVPETAHMLAALMDELNYEKIVATLASYDTIVIFSKDEADALDVKVRIEKVLADQWHFLNTNKVMKKAPFSVWFLSGRQASPSRGAFLV